MYYILTNNLENDEGDAVLEGESLYLNRIRCSFQEGKPLPKEDIDMPIKFEIDEFALRGTMTDHLSIDEIPGPVFSLEAKMLFEKIGVTNIEYYQLNLLDAFAQEIEGKKGGSKDRFEYQAYFIANVVGLIDCVDHQKSKLEYYYPSEFRERKADSLGTADDGIDNPFSVENPNLIDFVTSLVLDESKINPSMKIFRLLDQPDLLVFHDSVVNSIRKAGLSGFVFVPLSEYTDAIPDDDEIDEENKEEPELNVAPKQKQPELKTEPEQEEVSKETKKSKFSFLA